jgi:hypothetical protein
MHGLARIIECRRMAPMVIARSILLRLQNAGHRIQRRNEQLLRPSCVFSRRDRPIS